MATKTKQQRDVSRALGIAQQIKAGIATEEQKTELVAILTTLDARTGRRDPSKRTRRVAKKSAKRSAKKARARR